jgi:hypothetical protein
MKKILALLMFSALCSPAFAWDGVNLTNGHLIEITEGNLVRANEDIEVMDYNIGQINLYQVDEINDNQINVIDYASGEYQILDMELQ